jgi:seryl-tRNA synthetase
MKRQEEVEELQDKINRVSQHMQQGPSHHKMKDLRKDMEDLQKDLRKAQEDYQKELDKALDDDAKKGRH